MGTLAKLVVALGLDKGDFDKGMDDAQGSAETKGGGITGALLKIGAGVGGFLAVGKAAGEMKEFLGDSISAAMEAEDIAAQLDATLSKTGATTGVTADMVNGLAEKYSNLTTFEDDSIVAAGEVLARFDTISSQTFPGAMDATLDMAQALGIDAPQAAEMLGKALVEPGEGLNRLKAAGASFTAEQEAMIAQMVASGDTAGAQQIILDALSGSIGNAAEAAGGTTAGKWQILQNQLGNVKESIGAALMPTISTLVTKLSDFVSSDQFQAWLEKAGEWLSTTLPEAIQKASDFWTNTLQPALKTIWEFLEQNVIPILQDVWKWLEENLPPALQALSDLWNNTLKPALNTVWEFIDQNILPIFEKLYTWLFTDIPKAVETLKTAWDEDFGGIRTTIETVFGIISDVFDAFKKAFDGDWQGFGESLRTAWDATWGLIRDAVTAIWDGENGIKAKIGQLITNITTFIFETDWLQVGKDIVQGIADGITNAVDWIITAVQGIGQAAIDAIKGFLGISSPSRVFAAFGQNLVEGFALGISGGVDLPVRATAEISQRVTREASTAVSPATVQVQSEVNTLRELVANMPRPATAAEIGRSVRDAILMVSG